MSTASPQVSLLTGGTAGGSHPRIASWLRIGFERLGERFDVVHVAGPAGVEQLGSTRIVKLGTRRLRWAPLALSRYLRSTRPAIALATPIEVAVVAIPLGRATHTSIVPWEQTMARAHVRDQHPHRFRTLPVLERLTYGHAAAIAVTSKDVGDDLHRHLREGAQPRNMWLLPNPIDAAEIRRLAMPSINRSRRFRFCAIGRLMHQKGYDVLLDAVASAAPRLARDWEIVICGTGPLHERLQRDAARLGIADHVSFLGYVANPYPILASADAFVHPARWEGFGLVLAEALALGVPVVASSCPGVREKSSVMDNSAFLCRLRIHLLSPTRWFS